MSEFLIAYNLTSKFEGGYANDYDDSGGETWKGVSRNNEPNWIGWHIIDMYKKLKDFPANLKASIKLEKAVQSVYKNNYWDPVRGTEIINQDEANKIFDMAVNAGVGTAIILAKRDYGMHENTHMDDELINRLNHKV